MIDAKAVKDRGVKVADVEGFLHNIVAIIVGCSVLDAGFDPSAGRGLEASFSETRVDKGTHSGDLFWFELDGIVNI